MISKNLFEILNVSRNASSSEIQSAVGSLPAENRSAVQQLACEVLSDVPSRNSYKEILAALKQGTEISSRSAEKLHAATQLAKRLGLAVSPGADEFSFRVSDRITPRTTIGRTEQGGTDQIEQFTIGTTPVSLLRTAFQIHRRNGVSLIEINGKRYPTYEEFAECLGEVGFIYSVGTLDRPFMAAYTSGASAFPLGHAGDVLFGERVDKGPGNRIPTVYGIRNKRRRIQKLILDFYSKLAELIAKHEQHPPADLEQIFRQYAKQRFHYFP